MTLTLRTGEHTNTTQMTLQTVPPRFIFDLVTKTNTVYNPERRVWVHTQPDPDDEPPSKQPAFDEHGDHTAQTNTETRTAPPAFTDLNVFLAHHTPETLPIRDFRTQSEDFPLNDEGVFNPDAVEDIKQQLFPFRVQIRAGLTYAQNTAVIQEWLSFQEPNDPIFETMQRIGLWFNIGYTIQRADKDDPHGIDFVRKACKLIYVDPYRRVFEELYEEVQGGPIRRRPGDRLRPGEMPLIESRWIHNIHDRDVQESLNHTFHPDETSGIHQQITDASFWKAFVTARYTTSFMKSRPNQRNGSWLPARDAAHLMAMLLIMLESNGPFTRTPYTQVPFIQPEIDYHKLTAETYDDGNPIRNPEPATTLQNHCTRYTWQRWSRDAVLAPNASKPQRVMIDLINQDIVTAIVLPAATALKFGFIDTEIKFNILVHVSLVGSVKRLLSHARDAVLNKKVAVKLQANRERSQSYITTRDPTQKVYQTAQLTMGASGITHLSISHHQMFLASMKPESFIHVSPIATPNLPMFEQQLEHALTIPFADHGVERLWELGCKYDLIQRLPTFNTHAWAVNTKDESLWASVIIAVAQGKEIEDLAEDDITIEGVIATEDLAIDDETFHEESDDADDTDE